MNGEWDIIVSSLQDICQANQANSLDTEYKDVSSSIEAAQDDVEKLRDLGSAITNHKDNVDKVISLITPILDNINTLIRLKQLNEDTPVESPPAKLSTSGKKRRGDNLRKTGRSYYTSPYNASEPIVAGSEVAFKHKSGALGEEWIQCEVVKVLDHGKFDVRDIEPDENNNFGKPYRATWKEILLIPKPEEVKNLLPYQFGTKVVARYPETTSFYPAEVIGTKRDGRCRLRFDGEEEVGKETEVDRGLVLPYPNPKEHY